MLGKLFSKVISETASVAEQIVKLPARGICAIDDHDWEYCEIVNDYKCALCGARRGD